MTIENNNKVVPTGEVRTEKYEPLPKEKLYEIVGKPVYAIGDYIEPGWKVIKKIFISADHVEIAFTEDVNRSYDIKMVKCYDREIPDYVIAENLCMDDKETMEIVRNVIRSRLNR